MLAYLILNKLDFKCYVGIPRVSLEARWSKHLKNSKEGRPGHLYNAIRKHGEDVFTPVILSHASSWGELCRLEIHFINKYRSKEREFGYNLTLGGEGVVATEEIREKIRLSKTGIPCPEKVKSKIASTLKGRRVGINATPRPNLWKEARKQRRLKEREERRKLRERGLVTWGGSKKRQYQIA